MRIIALFGAIGATLLGGCASYQMGTPAALPYRTISIAPPINHSTLPQLEGPLNAALRQAIQQDGALSLATGSQSDATLVITILETRRNIAAVSAADVGRGRKFEFVVELELSLRKTNATGQHFIESRPLSVTQDIYADSGLVDAEYQAIPEISRKIATRVTETLVDLW